MADYPHLFSPVTLGDLALQNRVVMAPMTRSRALGNVPNEAMARYYALRADAGLLITEGTSPSPHGLGYARIPGIYSPAQVEGWRTVADAVHTAGGLIVVQLMHTGRVTHAQNLPAGGEVVAPSAIAAAGQMYTDSHGMQDLPTPRALAADEVDAAIEEFVAAARNAVAAGLDGVELHGANGYLIEQFLSPKSNQRDDRWGGSAEARNRFAVETARRTAAAIGAGRVGIRLSPYGVFNDQGPWDGVDDQFEALAKGLSGLGLAYVHLVDHAAMGAPAVPEPVKDRIAAAFGGPVIRAGGYDAARAEADLAAGKAAAIAFARPFIANPDLLARIRTGAPLNEPQRETFYTAGEEGYLDYPTLQRAAA